MKTKITKKILLWGDGAMTMNTNGELTFTMKIQTTYYVWGILVWRKVKFVDGTEEELARQMKTD